METTRKIRLFIVDDHQLVIDGICSLLLNEPEFEITGTCNKPADVEHLLEKKPTDVVLTDVQMPGVSGIELSRILKKRFPRIYILALSMYGDLAVIQQMQDSGISGYILKNTGKAELIEALKKVAAGAEYFSPEITKKLMKAARNNTDSASHLTNREIEIIRLIEQELGNKQIAEKLNISEQTVETHRKNIFRKTDTHSLVGLVKFAYEHKII